MGSGFSSTISMGIVWSLREAQRSPATVFPARDRNAMLVDKRERPEPLRQSSDEPCPQRFDDLRYVVDECLSGRAAPGER